MSSSRFRTRQARWLADQPAASLFISTITEAELRYDLAVMPGGKRRSAIAVEIEDMLREDFSNRIRPFNTPSGRRRRRDNGCP